MALIRISNVTPGQLVAVDVKDRSGRILLKANSELTEDNIKIIKSWGVVEIEIEGSFEDLITDNNNVVRAEQLQPEELQKIELELSNRFRFLNRSHPFINELYGVCLERRIKAQGGNNG